MAVRYKVIIPAFLAMLMSLVVGCTPKIGIVQEDLDLLGVFGLPKDDGWSLLTSPTDIWKVGSVMVFSSSGKPEWETNIDEPPFTCIPSEFWQIKPASAPQFTRGKIINYNLNISKTLGLSEEDISGSVNLIGAADKPNYQSTISLTDVVVSTLNRGAAKKYIRENYEDMGEDCKNYINSDDSYIIAETYAIKEGNIGITTLDGVKADFSALEEKIVEAGFSVDNSGSITMKDKAIVFAIKAANFNDSIRASGAVLKSKPDQLDQRLINSKEAIPITAGIGIGTWMILGAVGLSTIAVMAGQDDGGDEVATTPAILNLTPPPAE